MGFRVWGFGFRIQGSWGFRVEGEGAVWGLDGVFIRGYNKAFWGVKGFFRVSGWGLGALKV